MHWLETSEHCVNVDNRINSVGLLYELITSPQTEFISHTDNLQYSACVYLVGGGIYTKLGMQQTTFHVLVIFFGTLLLLGVTIGTPLDDYVNRPDPTYKYDILEAIEGPGYTLYNINMTSQTWKPGTLRQLLNSMEP